MYRSIHNVLCSQRLPVVTYVFTKFAFLVDRYETDIKFSGSTTLHMCVQNFGCKV